MKKVIKKLLSGKSVKYQAPAQANQSMLKGGAKPTLKWGKEGPSKNSYKVPKTPKTSGLGWGH